MVSYDIHITRKKYWSDSEGPIISLDEWVSYVATDPEIVHDDDNESEDFLYISHPDGPWALWWNPRGEIMTSSVDDATMAKLIAIALALEAWVLGDDDEQYIRVGESPLPAT
jgi:hypothetical protein